MILDNNLIAIINSSNIKDFKKLYQGAKDNECYIEINTDNINITTENDYPILEKFYFKFKKTDLLSLDINDKHSDFKALLIKNKLIYNILSLKDENQTDYNLRFKEYYIDYYKLAQLIKLEITPDDKLIFYSSLNSLLETDKLKYHQYKLYNPSKDINNELLIFFNQDDIKINQLVHHPNDDGIYLKKPNDNQTEIIDIDYRFNSSLKPIDGKNLFFSFDNITYHIHPDVKDMYFININPSLIYHLYPSSKIAVYDLENYYDLLNIYYIKGQELYNFFNNLKQSKLELSKSYLYKDEILKSKIDEILINMGVIDNQKLRIDYQKINIYYIKDEIKNIIYQGLLKNKPPLKISDEIDKSINDHFNDYVDYYKHIFIKNLETKIIENTDDKFLKDNRNLIYDYINYSFNFDFNFNQFLEIVYDFDQKDFLQDLITLSLNDLKSFNDIKTYALDELLENISLIMDTKPETIYELSDLALQNTRLNGILDHWTDNIDITLFSNYSLQEIIEKGMELNSSDSAYILTKFVQDELINQLEKYNDNPVDAMLNYLKDQGLDIDYYQKENELEM